VRLVNIAQRSLQKHFVKRMSMVIMECQVGQQLIGQLEPLKTL